MATIVSLVRKNPSPEIVTEGNLITGSDLWCLKVSAPISCLAAQVLLSALASGNGYGWLVPGIDGHPDNASVYATGFTISREEKLSTQFDITTPLTNEIQEINNSRRAVDAEAVFDFQEVDTIVEVDIDPLTGKAIAASNGQPYFPKVQRKGTETRIVISRNELQFNPQFAKNYRDKLNKDTLTIDGRSYSPRTILLESWTGTSAIDVDDSEYYQVKYQLLYDPKGHKIVLIDAAVGPDKAGNNPKVNGTSNVWKLDGAGLFKGKAAQEDPSDFETNEFNVHEEINMQNLRL